MTPRYRPQGTLWGPYDLTWEMKKIGYPICPVSGLHFVVFPNPIFLIFFLGLKREKAYPILLKKICMMFLPMRQLLSGIVSLLCLPSDTRVPWDFVSTFWKMCACFSPCNSCLVELYLYCASPWKLSELLACFANAEVSEATWENERLGQPTRMTRGKVQK